MAKLADVAIRHAALSDRIVLARFGKDRAVALETADAMSDFWHALVSFAFGGRLPTPGEGADISFGGGDEQYTITVRRAALAENQP